MAISDAQKALLTHAAKVLRASANVIADVHDEASVAIVATIVDAQDTADKLDAMANPPRKPVTYEVGSGSMDHETEMA